MVEEKHILDCRIECSKDIKPECPEKEGESKEMLSDVKPCRILMCDF